MQPVSVYYVKSFWQTTSSISLESLSITRHSRSSLNKKRPKKTTIGVNVAMPRSFVSLLSKGAAIEVMANEFGVQVADSYSLRTDYGQVPVTISVLARGEFNREADFREFKDSQGQPLLADVGIVVIAEPPYAEGVGDKADFCLSAGESKLIVDIGKQSKKVVVVLVAGRPRVITKQLPLAVAWVAAWLPGTEGGGIADVLFGDYPFTGKLSYSWPRSNEQLPININNSADKTGCDALLFSFGYGLAYGDPSSETLECNP